MKLPFSIAKFKQIVFIGLFSLGFIALGLGQTSVSMKVDSANVMIGDHIKAEIFINNSTQSISELDLSSFASIKNIDYEHDTTRYEKTADIEILESQGWNIDHSSGSWILRKMDNKGTSNVIPIVFSIYNEGKFAIKPPKLLQDSSNVIYGPSSIIEVHLPQKLTNPNDTIQLNPIKDIMKTKANFSDYAVYLYGLLIIAVLSLLVWYWFKKRKKLHSIEVVDVPVEPIIPPYEKALNALKQLEDKQLWQKGEIKLYQTELTDIMRSYLENAEIVNAMEMTTPDILKNLKLPVFDVAHKNQLSDILQIADLVKFAKATPDQNIHQQFMDLAKNWIGETHSRLTSLNQNSEQS